LFDILVWALLIVILVLIIGWVLNIFALAIRLSLLILIIYVLLRLLSVI